MSTPSELPAAGNVDSAAPSDSASAAERIQTTTNPLLSTLPTEGEVVSGDGNGNVDSPPNLLASPSQPSAIAATSEEDSDSSTQAAPSSILTSNLRCLSRGLPPLLTLRECTKLKWVSKGVGGRYVFDTLEQYKKDPWEDQLVVLKAVLSKDSIGLFSLLLDHGMVDALKQIRKLIPFRPKRFKRLNRRDLKVSLALCAVLSGARQCLRRLIAVGGFEYSYAFGDGGVSTAPVVLLAETCEACESLGPGLLQTVLNEMSGWEMQTETGSLEVVEMEEEERTGEIGLAAGVLFDSHASLFETNQSAPSGRNVSLSLRTLTVSRSALVTAIECGNRSFFDVALSHVKRTREAALRVQRMIAARQRNPAVRREEGREFSTVGDLIGKEEEGERPRSVTPLAAALVLGQMDVAGLLREAGASVDGTTLEILVGLHERRLARETSLQKGFRLDALNFVLEKGWVDWKSLKNTYVLDGANKGELGFPETGCLLKRGAPVKVDVSLLSSSMEEACILLDAGAVVDLCKQKTKEWLVDVFRGTSLPSSSFMDTSEENRGGGGGG